MQSTLFNALTNTQAAQAANYPFCTIDPNIGRVCLCVCACVCVCVCVIMYIYILLCVCVYNIVCVCVCVCACVCLCDYCQVAIPDARLDTLAQVPARARFPRSLRPAAPRLAAYPRLRMLTVVSVVGQIAKSAKVVGAQLEFVDIAGLVRGASEGAGLGNKFLGNVRQVSMILMLLRCFDDTEKDIITHVDGSVDPIRDLETIETELLLADIQTLSKRESSAGNLIMIIFMMHAHYDLIRKRVCERASEGESARAHTHTQVGLF